MPIDVKNASGSTVAIPHLGDFEGVAGTANAKVLTVQGIASGTPVAVTATLAAGTAAIGKLAANTATTYIGDVVVTAVTPGTAAANLGKAEDTAAASGDTGVMVLGVRNDTPAVNTSTDGDYAALSLNNKGFVRTETTVVRKNISVSKTRPTGTTAYAPNDVLNDSTSAGTNWDFAGCARLNGGSGIITGVKLEDSANQTVKPVFELHLFTSNITADNDNAVFTPTDTEGNDYVGVITFDTTFIGDASSAASGNSYQFSNNVNLPFVCAAGTTSLYGVLVVRNAYTPVDSEVFRITLTVEQD